MTSVLLLSLGNIKSSSRGLLDRQEIDNSILSLLEKTNSNKGRDFSWIFSVYSDYALSMLFLPPVSQKLMEDTCKAFLGITRQLCQSETIAVWRTPLSVCIGL